MPNWEDDGPDFHGGGDGWGPCFCADCRAEAEKQKEISDRYERKVQAWASKMGIELDLTTDIGLRNAWDMSCMDGPLLQECDSCSKRFLRERQERCPYCSSQAEVVRRILPSEVPRN